MSAQWKALRTWTENKDSNNDDGCNADKWRAHGPPKPDGGDQREKWDAHNTAQCNAQPSLPSTQQWAPAHTGGKAAASQTEELASSSDGVVHHDLASEPATPVHPIGTPRISQWEDRAEDGSAT